MTSSAVPPNIWTSSNSGGERPSSPPIVEKKIAFLRSADVDFYFGGTLFEKYVIQDRFRQYFELLRDYECQYVEVSNGTIDLEDSRIIGVRRGAECRIPGDL